MAAQAIARVQAAGSPALALDCTAGNGHDTLFLAEAVGENGRVIAFDIQAEALNNTAQRLEKFSLAHRVELRLQSHASLAGLPSGWAGNICLAMYNLGFLPGGAERGLTTQSASTLESLAGLAPMLRPGGLVTLHCYGGHPGGAAEMAAVHAWCAALPWDDWRVLRHEFANKPQNPESLILLHKLEAVAQ